MDLSSADGEFCCMCVHFDFANQQIILNLNGSSLRLPMARQYLDPVSGSSTTVALVCTVLCFVSMFACSLHTMEAKFQISSFPSSNSSIVKTKESLHTFEHAYYSCLPSFYFTGGQKGEENVSLLL